MKHLRTLLVGAAFAALATIAWGQAVTISNLSGNEISRAAISLGGTGIDVPMYAMRSGETHTLVATGTTVATTIPNTSGIVLATGAITTWNIVLPTAPYNGQRVIIGCPGGTVSTLGITASLPASVAIVGTNPTSCTSGGLISQAAAFTYDSTANTWYRYL